jgi:NADP-dependent 3-hydroxy acid dehydrogenase YdfG
VDVAGAFAGKLAVVTGATSGIGAAIVRRLCSDGATVIGIGRQAERLASEAARAEGRFIGVAADLAEARGRALAVEAVCARAPRLDALINNAGEASYDPPLALGVAGWRALFEINLHAALELSLALAPRLAAGGNLLNVSSVTARFVPSARFAAYAATKGALERITEALRLELDPRGVRVTSLAPGLVDTPIYDQLPSFAGARDKLRQQVPRWLDAADVAEAVAWVLARPPHVAVAELMLLPSGQAR